MNLLFLSKRRPMDRDLISEPYGRFYYLPKLLADRGHDVTLLLLDYKNEAVSETHRQGIRWLSAPVSAYLRVLNARIKHSKPDWVIGFSDTYFGILASHYGRKYDIRACIDAYDNYEGYLPWMKPLHWLWRRALANANLITAAGPALIELMSANSEQATAVVPMATDPIGFQQLDKAGCRALLQLPPTAKLVGYCGSLHRSRGVEVFFDAIRLMQAKHPEVQFIHSGRTAKDVAVPPSLHSLGYIDESKMPALLNSMDTLVVINRTSAFGQYSHPVKLYEAMSCQVPVVATRTKATEWILSDHPERLVTPEDPDALSRAISASLSDPAPSYRSVPTWQSCCTTFENALNTNVDA